MDLPPTSDRAAAPIGEAEAGPKGTARPPWLQFWSAGGERRAGGPGEWTRALVEVRPGGAPLPEDAWAEHRLLRNGEPLPLRREKVAGAVRTVAPWPRSGPGRYELTLIGPETELEEVVEVEPDMIGQKAFRDLLSELESELPTQVAFALKRAGGLSGIQLSQQEGPTLEQELVRLRRAANGTDGRPGLAEVLRQLAGRHQRELTSEERWVRSGRAQRPRGERLGHAYARPDNADEDGLKQVPDARSRHTADVYENRLLKQFARQLRLRLRRVEPLLGEKSEELAGEAAQLRETLRAARQKATFLEEVSGLKRPPTRASQTLQKRPLYRAALKGYLEFQREMGVNLDAPELEAPLDNLPFLYQLWCTLQAIRALLQVAEEEGLRARRSSLFKREGGLLELSLGGRALELSAPQTGVRIEVYAERSYGRGQADSLHSISYAQRPDLAIEATGPSGPAAVYLLDPKYKLDTDRSDEDTGGPAGHPMKADLDKMHAYRDAIRDASGQRVVRYAATVYPGPTETFSKGLEAIGARPGRTDALSTAMGRILRDAMEMLGEQ